MANAKLPLLNDESHMMECHQRWAVHRHRRPGQPEYVDEWYAQQCGACRYYVPLAGAFGWDWGACSNEKSAFDGRVRFEHDGCEHHDDAGEWVR